MKTLTTSTIVDVQLIKRNKFNKKGNIYGWCTVETKPTENAPKPLKVNFYLSETEITAIKLYAYYVRI